MIWSKYPNLKNPLKHVLFPNVPTSLFRIKVSFVTESHFFATEVKTLSSIDVFLSLKIIPNGVSDFVPRSTLASWSQRSQNMSKVAFSKYAYHWWVMFKNWNLNYILFSLFWLKIPPAKRGSLKEFAYHLSGGVKNSPKFIFYYNKCHFKSL